MDSLFLDGHNEEEKDHNGLTVDHRHLSHDHPAGTLRVQDNSETHPSYTVKMTKVGIEIQNLETNNRWLIVVGDTQLGVFDREWESKLQALS